MVKPHFVHYRWPLVAPAERSFVVGVSSVTPRFFQFLMGHVPYDEKAERKGEGGRVNAFASLCVGHYWSNLGIHMPHLVEMQIVQELVP